MAEKISEKTAEMLFSHLALRFLPAGEASLYAPSSRREYVKGYDAKLIGPGGFLELFLQFKAPRPLKKFRFGFSATPHQHGRLKSYPRNTAFYVAHTFRSLAEIDQAQRELDVAAFLRRFMAVEVSRLPTDLDFIQYRACPGHPPFSVGYKASDDGDRRRAPHCVRAKKGWMTGDVLLRRFRRARIGAWVLSAEARMPQAVEAPPATAREPWILSRDEVKRMATNDADNWGVALRVGPGSRE